MGGALRFNAKKVTRNTAKQNKSPPPHHHKLQPGKQVKMKTCCHVEKTSEKHHSTKGEARDQHEKDSSDSVANPKQSPSYTVVERY